MTDLVRLPCVDEMRGVEDLCVCACTHAVVISHFGPHWSHGAVLDLRGHLQGVMEEQCGGRVDCSGQSPAAAGKDSSLETSVMCVCGGGGTLSALCHLENRVARPEVRASGLGHGGSGVSMCAAWHLLQVSSDTAGSKGQGGVGGLDTLAGFLPSKYNFVFGKFY